MPVFDVTAPDGRTFTVNGPEGSTLDQAIEYAKNNLMGPDNLGADEAQRGNIGGQRSVMDQLLGVGGPRHQLPPERMIRDFASHVGQGIENSGNYVRDEMRKANEPPPTQISDSDVSPLSTTITDAASLGVGPSIRSGMAFRTGNDLRAAATRNYESPAVTDLRISPTGTSALANQTVSNIESKGARPYRPGMQEIYNTIDELRGLPNGQSVPKGVTEFKPEITGPGYQMGEDVFHPAPATVQDITGTRTVLRDIAQSNTDPLTGRMNSAGGRAAQSGNDITKYLNNIPAGDVVAGDAAAASRNLATAGKDYAASNKLDIIDALSRRADLKKAAANSGTNMNTERQEVKNFILNQQKSSGLSPVEMSAAEKSVFGTYTGNRARSLANALDPRGAMAGPSLAGYGASGGAVGQFFGLDPAVSAIVSGLEAQAIGKVARGVANASEDRAFNNFRQIVLEGSPSARASMSNDKRQAMNAALAKALLYGTQSQRVGLKVANDGDN